MNFGKIARFCLFLGSDFITKAEFDSLKNNFQSQIDQYNSSIDSKIDGAIATYLAGVKLATVTTNDIFKMNVYINNHLFKISSSL